MRVCTTLLLTLLASVVHAQGKPEAEAAREAANTARAAMQLYDDASEQEQNTAYGYQGDLQNVDLCEDCEPLKEQADDLVLDGDTYRVFAASFRGFANGFYAAGTDEYDDGNFGEAYDLWVRSEVAANLSHERYRNALFRYQDANDILDGIISCCGGD